jgi:hypothetical protein
MLIQISCAVFIKVGKNIFNSFIFLRKQVKIMYQRNDKNYIDGEKGHTELVSSSLKLIAGEIGKRRYISNLYQYSSAHEHVRVGTNLHAKK